jgi:hypothetical protein
LEHRLVLPHITEEIQEAIAIMATTVAGLIVQAEAEELEVQVEQVATLEEKLEHSTQIILQDQIIIMRQGGLVERIALITD